MDCENDAIALAERYDHWPSLHAWALLRHDELTTRKICIGLGKQNCQLDWEYVLTVEVLVQTVVVIDSVLKEKRCRPLLTGVVATLDEVGMRVRIACIDSHCFVPSICNAYKMRINSCPEPAQEIR